MPKHHADASISNMATLSIMILITLALNYNLVIKAVAHILSGILVIFLYTTYVVYILTVVLINIPNNTLFNIKRAYKHINR